MPDLLYIWGQCAGVTLPSHWMLTWVRSWGVHRLSVVAVVFAPSLCNPFSRIPRAPGWTLGRYDQMPGEDLPQGPPFTLLCCFPLGPHPFPFPLCNPIPLFCLFSLLPRPLSDTILKGHSIHSLNGQCRRWDAFRRELQSSVLQMPFLKLLQASFSDQSVMACGLRRI
jgi:hypothetical protein